jgi:type ISP restriction-modification system protein
MDVIPNRAKGLLFRRAGKQQVPHRVSDSVRNDIAKDRSRATDGRDVFHGFAKAGQRLAEIHVHYEQQPEYKLTKTEKAGEKLDYRVTKMKLSKDKTTLIYNQFLTLSGIPKETYEYRLWQPLRPRMGHRSISSLNRQTQRHHQRPKLGRRQRIYSAINSPSHHVSLETVKIVKELPGLGIPEIPGS